MLFLKKHPDFRKELHDFPRLSVPMRKSAPIPHHNPTWDSPRQRNNSQRRNAKSAFGSPPAAGTAGCCWYQTAAAHPAGEWHLPLSTVPIRRSGLQSAAVSGTVAAPLPAGTGAKNLSVHRPCASGWAARNSGSYHTWGTKVCWG